MEVENEMMREIDFDGVISLYGDLRVWGVVSNFAVDVLYDGLTYVEALKKAEAESSEPGRDARIVLLVRYFPGTPLRSL